jgi:hypothetical protein|uniref:Uncharacterized protein n=1 Tax=viral metagenome TaxID=1070528 RepID=A0A6C0JMQ3_9ZZZZ
MASQIFRKNVPSEILFKLLDKICFKTDKYYLIDMNAFRKLIFHNYHTEFCEKLKEYYNLSKLFYLERKMVYNSFTNIVRQICKLNNIMFTSQIKYNESKYNIDFFIYYEGNLGSPQTPPISKLANK